MSGLNVLSKRVITRVLIVNAVIAGVVWVAWFLLFNTHYFGILSQQWRVALTMAFGSLVGGGTSEGGGAIGFPVLTKLLGVPADTARLFTYAIQSIGMGCASLSILLCRIRIEARVIRWGAPGAILGAVLSVCVIAPAVPLPVVRVAFTMILVALALALALQLLRKGYKRNVHLPSWGLREKGFVVAAGVIGGILSGVAGVGENTVMFILLVLLFRLSEKVATPTTVILMTLVSLTCFASHIVVTRDFDGPVVDYWIAAVPVVAVGAPLGAWICTKMSPLAVRVTLWVLITAELVSTLLIVPFTPVLWGIALGSLAVALTISLLFVQSARYSERAAAAELVPSSR